MHHTTRYLPCHFRPSKFRHQHSDPIHDPLFHPPHSLFPLQIIPPHLLAPISRHSMMIPPPILLINRPKARPLTPTPRLFLLKILPAPRRIMVQGPILMTCRLITNPLPESALLFENVPSFTHHWQVYINQGRKSGGAHEILAMCDGKEIAFLLITTRSLLRTFYIFAIHAHPSLLFLLTPML